MIYSLGTNTRGAAYTCLFFMITGEVFSQTLQFIPKSLELKSIVLGYILKYRNY